MKRPHNTDSTLGRGSVSADEIVPLREFGRRLGLGKRALCDCQRDGLRTVLVGRMKFVLGSDAVAWFGRLAENRGEAATMPEMMARLENDTADIAGIRHTLRLLAQPGSVVEIRGLDVPRGSGKPLTAAAIRKAAQDVYEQQPTKESDAIDAESGKIINEEPEPEPPKKQHHPAWNSLRGKIIEFANKKGRVAVAAMLEHLATELRRKTEYE
jgi:hypothetical protein